MTIDDIIRLIQAVSDNGLTSFEYEEGDQMLVLKKKKKKNVSQAPVAPVVISQPAAPVVSPMAVAVPTGETGLSGLAGKGLFAAPAVEEKAEEAQKEDKLDIGSDKVITSPLV